jgi:hypothetical protein
MTGVKFNVTYNDGDREVKLFQRDKATLERAAAILSALRDAGCDDEIKEFVSSAVSHEILESLLQDQPSQLTDGSGSKD